MKTLPTITVIGSGYVGVTSAAIFANAGYKVYALEINPERLAAIKKGTSFFYEEYINPLLKNAVDSGMLIATDSYAEAIPESDIVFSCVGTPDNPDGSSNLNYVFAAADETMKHITRPILYVQKSTVPVGTGDKVKTAFASADIAIDYVSNPEFLRESTAVIDTLWPDRTVVGGDSDQANAKILEIYNTVNERSQHIAEVAEIPEAKIRHNHAPTEIATGLSSAELIKVSANAFLALKISFANSIAKLSDAAGGDIVEIMDGIGADRRIGRSFLNAGRGYGGGCFPKDVSGLISSGLQHGVDLQIMQAANAENEAMPGYILEKALEQLKAESFAGKKVALLGIAFKAGTSDIRKSPALKMANLLVEKMDAEVYAYDPQAFIESDTRKQLHNDIVVCDDMDSALAVADIAVIATDWPEFRETSPETYASNLNSKILIDAMNCMNPHKVKDAGLTYIGVGR